MPLPSRARRLAVATFAALAASFGGAATASADSVSVSFTDAAGVPDPAVGIGRTMTIKGNVSTPTRLYTKVRPAGGAPCAPSATSDSASEVYYGSFNGGDAYGPTVQGNFTITKTGVWNTPGDFQYCFWLASNPSQAVTPITQLVSFRRSTGVISAVISPLGAAPKTKLTITVAGNSEAPSNAHAKVRLAGGAPCAPSYSADSGTGLFSGRDVNGPFSITDTYTPPVAGTYLLCLYLSGSSSDANPIAAQPILFGIVAPPPPCVVPTLPGGTSLGDAQGALGAASCTLGGQSLQPSDFPRGTVIATNPSAGTSLPNGTGIGLVISDGKACVVPSIGNKTKLSRAKAALYSAGCTPGAVQRIRSKRKKGTLVRYLPRSRTTLAPRAAVGMAISKGPRR